MPNLVRHDARPRRDEIAAAIPVPNPRIQRKRERIVLRGEIPSPANPPSGCRFRTRCPYAMEICSEEEPPLFMSPAGVMARCHLHTSGPKLARLA